MPVALGLIFFGILLLLRNLGVINGNLWHYVWPLVFVIIGISLILKGRDSG